MSGALTKLARNIAWRRFSPSLRRDEGPEDARVAERFEKYFSTQRGFFETEARGCVQCLAEPTPEMVFVGGRTLEIVGTASAKDVWLMMIAEILK